MLQFLGQDSYFEYSVPQDQPSKQYITTHHNVRQGIAKTGYNIERDKMKFVPIFNIFRTMPFKCNQ